ncbi:YegP family protein [Gordonia alkanivorans]|uniref:YegP family protein n=1 Tax=Gordonia alkanivorans TaxID=84096 RepID=UPI0024B84F36|nr:YegP family protein [Gordonia alkanivorans]MDJ0010128.1 YegP family protein [Gordonia alkanivorans]MDJ0495682.1 YegP family protein [Gordonia alkanivorans]
MIVYEKPEKFRGTIEVYVGFAPVFAKRLPTEWRWRCKSRNGQILASGEGYKRRAGALNAIDAQYAVKFASDSVGHVLVLPWRLVIHDRHGNVERIGAVY